MISQIMFYFDLFCLASGDGNQTGGMSRSVPSSPGDRKGQPGWGETLPIVGSAESLVGRVSHY
jgi:hypothetical protein